MVAATEIDVDVVLSLSEQEEQHGMLLERSRGVLETERETTVEVMQHRFEVVLEGAETQRPQKNKDEDEHQPAE